jgi:hypothetical protein
MASFTVYRGEFNCHTCKALVPTLRCYAEEQKLSWMCKDKHLTEVFLGKRKKKDFDREK